MNFLKKNYLSLVITLLVFLNISCDAPSSKRNKLAKDNFTQDIDISSNARDSSGSENPTVVIENGDGSGDRGSDDNQQNANIPQELRHCKWSYDGKTGFDKTNDAHLGSHTICQSTSNEQDLWIQVKNAITDRQVCFIPTHSQSNSGSSIYIGEPRCRFLNESNKIFKVSVYKNRRGYSNLNLNGVMVMKDEPHFFNEPYNKNLLTPDAYLFCMEYLQTYQDDSYCRAFTAAGHYVFKKF